jgi:NADPH:quinone reductase-like Zn-dependent oxidoreductase
MGEMGREFDGGYAEYALLPNALLMPVTTTLPWEVLAALPETYLTAQGALDVLGARPGERLLIRGNVEAGLYRPNLDRVIDLDEVAAAHRYMENNQATGKVVMLPWGASSA